jgi:hypothetical protein
MKITPVVLAVCLLGCHHPTTAAPAPAPSELPASTPIAATVTLVNETKQSVQVFVAFGASSVVLPASWPFCNVDAGLVCFFPLAAKTEQSLPLAGKWLNATFSFAGPVTCNTTKAEINVNNPKWFDIADISLVDGFSKALRIDTTDTADGGMRILGPVWGPYGNEKNYGVYPDGCDICVERQSPPCGMKPGRDGCKSGSQYDPSVPCQFQGATMGGAGAYRVVYLGDLRPVGE